MAIGGALWSGRDQGKLGPWKLHFFFFFNEIKELVSHLLVEFRLVLWSANGLADALAKEGAVRSSYWEDSFL